MAIQAPSVRSGPGVFQTNTKKLGPHKRGCLLVPVPDPLRKEITDWCLENILDEHLGKGGRELSPHITILYGFKDDSPETILAVSRLLIRHGPFRIKLGSLSAFRKGYGKWKDDEGDVLKLEVESDDLHELNAELRALHDVEVMYPESEIRIRIPLNSLEKIRKDLIDCGCVIKEEL
jgi:hypothetical protein